MKLTKSALKRIIKEEVQKIQKSLKETTVAQKATEIGVGPGSDDMLGEMASVADTANERGLDTSMSSSRIFHKWWKDVNPGKGAGGFGVGSLEVNNGEYAIFLDRTAAEKMEWPEELAANWEIDWDPDTEVYIISTDVSITPTAPRKHSTNKALQQISRSR